MLNELKAFFNNIKNVRHLLTEGVSSDVIKDAIENHEYLTIYYRSEEDKNPHTGYRTIRPYVLGTTPAGNLAVRAFQDKGGSASLKPDAPRTPRPDHEFHTDTDGKTKTGWRLYLISNILSAYPTGRRFNDKDGVVELPPIYKNPENTLLGLTNIIASIAISSEKEIEKSYSGATTQVKAKVGKWDSFKNANVANRQITVDDINKLYDLAKKVQKRSPNNFFVAINDRNDYYLQDMKIKSKFPQNAIVGDLVALRDKLIPPTKPTGGKKPAEINFAKQAEAKLQQTIAAAKNKNIKK